MHQWMTPFWLSWCVHERVWNTYNYIAYLHIVNKKFNIGLNEFVIVGYSLFIINNNNNNEPICIRLK